MQKNNSTRQWALRKFALYRSVVRPVDQYLSKTMTEILIAGPTLEIPGIFPLAAAYLKWCMTELMARLWFERYRKQRTSVAACHSFVPEMTPEPGSKSLAFVRWLSVLGQHLKDDAERRAPDSRMLELIAPMPRMEPHRIAGKAPLRMSKSKLQ